MIFCSTLYHFVFKNSSEIGYLSTHYLRKTWLHLQPTSELTMREEDIVMKSRNEDNGEVFQSHQPCSTLWSQ